MVDIGKLTGAYQALEEAILEEIRGKPNHGKECDCDEPSKFCIIDDDNKISCYCLNCGGDYISW